MVFNSSDTASISLQLDVLFDPHIFVCKNNQKKSSKKFFYIYLGVLVLPSKGEIDEGYKIHWPVKPAKTELLREIRRFTRFVSSSQQPSR